MNLEEITALAREYAEAIRPYNDKTAPLSILDIREAERLIRFLLRRYCLVEKSKVAEEYKRAIETNRNGKETGAYSLCTMGSARKVLLESLFPEIAKEVEE